MGSKYPVVGILDRATPEVRTEAVGDTNKDELKGYLEENVRSDATVYSDEMKSYEDLPQPHEAGQYSTGEYVREEVHTNSLESSWSMLKRGYVGVYHRFSEQHLDRYVKEYAKRRSMRELDTIDQMTGTDRAVFGHPSVLDGLRRILSHSLVEVVSPLRRAITTARNEGSKCLVWLCSSRTR